MKRAFSSMHPIINFTYFAAVIGFGMFFLHPVYLGLSFLGALTYGFWLNGWRSFRFTFAFLFPMLLFVVLVNTLFNHNGMTTLFYLRDNPITLESLLYGSAAGLMLATILLWFSSYNVVMTSDKFVYLFGRILPAASLIFSMVLRFVPRFKAQIKIISNAQKCIGRDLSNGTLRERARHGMKILSIMVTWALENAIDTADSMKSRGYGLPGRSSFSMFRFDLRDRSVLAVLVILITGVLIGALLGQSTMQYFPSVKLTEVTGTSLISYLIYGLLCFLPMIIDLGEERKWKHFKYRT